MATFDSYGRFLWDMDSVPGSDSETESYRRGFFALEFELTVPETPAPHVLVRVEGGNMGQLSLLLGTATRPERRKTGRFTLH